MSKSGLFILALSLPLILSFGCRPRAKTIELEYPINFAADQKGYVYVVDRSIDNRKDHLDPDWHKKDTIIKFSPNGTAIEKFELPQPKQTVRDIAVSGSGTIYLLSSTRNSPGRDIYVILSLSPDNQVRRIRSFVRPWTSKSKPFPSGLAIDDDENIFTVYRTDTEARRIVKLGQDGRILKNLRSAKKILVGSEDRPRKFLGTDSGGQVYVLEADRRKDPDATWVQKFTKSGGPSMVPAKEPISKDRYDDSFAIDNFGAIYLSGGTRIKKYGSSGHLIRNIRPSGKYGSSIISASDKYFYELEVDRASLKSQISKFSSEGQLLEVWSSSR